MWRKSIASLLLLGLIGCGEGDNASSTTDNVLAPLASDAFNQLSMADGQTEVSLKEAVVDPQGLPVTLESVTVSHSDCPAPTSINREQLSFTLEADVPDMCFYDYTVKNHPKESVHAKSVSAQSNVMINLTSDPALLAPKSETAQVGDTITIDVSDPILTAGYTLDSEVVVLGDGVASGDGTTDEITYDANAQGVTRLVYTMTNADGSALLMGTVDVAVSGPGNHAPEVEGASFTEQSDGSNYGGGAKYTFDISSYVTDADGDDIQLIQVEAWNATVELAAPNDPSNLSFTFETLHPGTHYVTYVVSDHKGGYGVAQAQIFVDTEYILEGETYFPQYSLAGGHLASETYKLYDSAQNEVPTQWSIKNAGSPEVEGISMTTTGTITIDPSKNLPDDFTIVAVGTYTGIVSEFNATFFGGLIEVHEPNAYRGCRYHGYYEISEDFASNVLNSKYRQDISSFFHEPYPNPAQYVNGNVVDMYGRLSAYVSVPGGGERAPALIRCPYPTCENSQSGRTLSYDEYATFYSAYSPRDYLVCEQP
ncbi:hypothetical protein BCT11_07690 [Vibrio sp. 10N.222.52.B12]|uniref:hypothetical protein n=1 Tax=Vibrio sp. 10N.222.52.B12 TaxID=1880840 RepID=UPI000CC495B7|nr:hypothetical protein [Vibrio sp. 10N.222.52.B12]PMO44228.1 hypothetical protein BCT11_07690 [Vibrio sp. 10N.222.52.B12]